MKLTTTQPKSAVKFNNPSLLACCFLISFAIAGCALVDTMEVDGYTVSAGVLEADPTKGRPRPIAQVMPISAISQFKLESILPKAAALKSG